MTLSRCASLAFRRGGNGLAAIVLFGLISSAGFGAMINLSDPSGLAAQVEFNLVNPTTLEVRLQNTSTGLPKGFSNSDQLLTSVSWDFGGVTSITGGSVITGPTSASVNFSLISVGASADVSGEYGYGNGGTTGLLPNLISGNQAGTTPFGGPNLDGPIELNGPQAGLVASPALMPLGGLGAIQGEWIATLTMSDPISDLSFLSNGVIVEFGSDAAFIPEPATATLALIGGALLAVCRLRRGNVHPC